MVSLLTTLGVGAVDPFIPTDQRVGGISYNEVYNYTGRTQVFPSLVPGEHTTVLVIFGDSLGASTDNVAYVPINSTKVQDFSLQNGGVYLAKTPALSCSDEGDPPNNGFWGHRLADKLINGGRTQRVIVASIAIGSTGTQLWTSSMFNWRFGVLWRRLNAQRLLDADKVIVMSSLGGLDQIEGKSATTVKNNLDAIISSIRAAGFQTQPIYLSISSWAGGSTGGANGLAVREGIEDAIDANTNVFAGGDTDVITLAGRYDTNHFNATGSDQAATIRYNVISPTF